MSKTPDRRPGAADEEAIFFEPTTSASVPGEMRYDGTKFSLGDAQGPFDPRNDHKVRVSSDDLLAAFLLAKVVAGPFIQVTKLNPGANEQLQIEVVNNPPGVPANLGYIEDNALSGTVAGTYQQKLRLSVASLPVGTYIVFWQYVVTGTANNTQIGSQVQLDDVTTLDQIKVRLAVADSAQSVTGFKLLTAFSGSHTFDIEWYKSGGSGTAQIRSARLVFWRIE